MKIPSWSGFGGSQLDAVVAADRPHKNSTVALTPLVSNAITFVLF